MTAKEMIAHYGESRIRTDLSIVMLHGFNSLYTPYMVIDLIKELSRLEAL